MDCASRQESFAVAWELGDLVMTGFDRGDSVIGRAIVGDWLWLQTGIPSGVEQIMVMGWRRGEGVVWLPLNWRVV